MFGSTRGARGSRRRSAIDPLFRSAAIAKHRRIQVLPESHRTSIWVSVSLQSSDQDAPERSGSQSGAKSRDRSWAIAASPVAFGGLSETEYKGVARISPA